jgi:hypothetical protein
VKRREFISRQLNLALFTDAKLDLGHKRARAKTAGRYEMSGYKKSPEAVRRAQRRLRRLYLAKPKRAYVSGGVTHGATSRKRPKT